MSSPQPAKPPPPPQTDAGQTDAPEDEGQTNIEIDYIDEALEESIPASDPPALAPTAGVGPPDPDADKCRD